MALVRSQTLEVTQAVPDSMRYQKIEQIGRIEDSYGPIAGTHPIWRKRARANPDNNVLNVLHRVRRMLVLCLM